MAISLSISRIAARAVIAWKKSVTVIVYLVEVLHNRCNFGFSSRYFRFRYDCVYVHAPLAFAAGLALAAPGMITEYGYEMK